MAYFHTYSSTFRQLGVDLKVQQEFAAVCRCENDGTITPQAVSAEKREAHSRVVQMVAWLAGSGRKMSQLGHLWTCTTR
jgi:hypothetical protein